MVTFYSIASFSWNDFNSSSNFCIRIYELSSLYFFSSSIISWMMSSFSMISFDFTSVVSSKFLLWFSIWSLISDIWPSDCVIVYSSIWFLFYDKLLDSHWIYLFLFLYHQVDVVLEIFEFFWFSVIKVLSLFSFILYLVLYFNNNIPCFW